MEATIEKAQLGTLIPRDLNRTSQETYDTQNDKNRSGKGKH